MTGARLKLLSLVLVAALAALVLLAWSQLWFEVDLGGESDVVGVAGDVAAAALPPLAFASFALVLALAIAGPVFRVILGILEALLGVTIVVVSAVALADPIAASSPALTEHTGVTGVDSLARTRRERRRRSLADRRDRRRRPDGRCSASLIAVTGHRWPRSGRKYSRSRLRTPRHRRPVDEWDALSEGDDPTRP